MGKGFLKINLFTGDDILPVADVPIIIRDENGSVLHNLTSDRNGLAGPVELYAPDVAVTPEGVSINFAAYNVEVPKIYGYQRVLRHGVQIFDGQTTILPVRMHPLSEGMDETDEVYIPKEHGADLEGPRFGGEDIEAMQVNLGRVLQDNNIRIPTHITVHLGSPNCCKGINNKQHQKSRRVCRKLFCQLLFL